MHNRKKNMPGHLKNLKKQRMSMKKELKNLKKHRF